MGINAASSNNFTLIFGIFTLLFADLIVTNMSLSQLKGESNGKNSENSTEISKLTKTNNSKFKYTIVIITLVLIYYIVNALTFLFAHNIK